MNNIDFNPWNGVNGQQRSLFQFHFTVAQKKGIKFFDISEVHIECSFDIDIPYFSLFMHSTHFGWLK